MLDGLDGHSLESSPLDSSLGCGDDCSLVSLGDGPLVRLDWPPSDGFSELGWLLGELGEPLLADSWHSKIGTTVGAIGSIQVPGGRCKRTWSKTK